MGRYITKRLFLLIPIMIGVSIVVFFFVRLLPGGPADALLGERGSAAERRQIEESLGLDRPIPLQYVSYMRTVVSGEFGNSIRTRQPVIDELFQRFPATVELAGSAIIIAVLLGVPLGFLAAKRYGGPGDQAGLFFSLIGISFPVFFLALVLKFVFAVKLGWLPSLGRIDVTRAFEPITGFYLLDSLLHGDTEAFVDVARHLVLPALALATIPLAIIARITRAATLEVLNEDYVRTGRAKGLSTFLIDRRHVLRNALLPVVTIVGLQTGLLLTGAILTETVFAWPGVGTWMLEAIRFRDYAVLQTGILFFAVVIIVVNLLVDLSYAFLNPRIRYR
ncbi:MAG TPA: ABC transporter permease [Euzebya sp.]|nr:ABC transporter permease [Euzebya sp.]